MRSFAKKHDAAGASHAADAITATHEHPLLRLQHTAGNQAVQRLFSGMSSEAPHRARMERAFGADFSSVRAHRGAGAALDSIDANAATSGEHIAFAGADPDPRVVAHELAHVMQQRRGGRGRASDVDDSPHLEAEADAAAGAAITGRSVPSLAGGAVGIQRDRRRKTPSPILYVGTTENAPKEIETLTAANADRGGITAITTSPTQAVVEQGGVTFDLNTRSGIEAFVKTLGLAADVESKTIALLDAQLDTGRDELAALIRIYAAAEADPGTPRMKRVVLSGHSGGLAVFGTGGRLEFKTFVELAGIFPKAAAQVEHLHVSGCSAGGEANVELYYLNAFPNVKTIWGYADACPTDWGAPKAMGRWEKATEKPGVTRLPKESGVATWSGGRYRGPRRDKLSVQQAIDQVDAQESMFNEYFEGKKADRDSHAGPLTTYYRQVNRVVGRVGLSTADRTRLEQRRAVALRLRYYDMVRTNFVAKHGTTIQAGYDALKLTMPDYATLPRKDAVDAIRAFTTAAAGGGDAASKAGALLQALLDLAPDVIDETWIIEDVVEP